MSETAAILKLDADCCDEIFEYLSLHDMQSLGQTCKALRFVTGQYIQRTFDSAIIAGNGVQMAYNPSEQSAAMIHISPYFHRFIKGALHCRNDPKSIDFQSTIQHNSDFSTLNELVIIGKTLDKHLIASLQNILYKIEVVRIDSCQIDGDFYEVFLKFCTNLKKLYIRFDCEIVKRKVPNQWLLQEYPSLEVFQLKPGKSFKIKELRTFLERNSSIQTFSTTSRNLCKSGIELLESSVKLDKLVVNDGYILEPVDKEMLCELLKKLYDRGFYKRLRFKFYTFNQTYVWPLATLRGVEEFLIDEIEGDCDFSRFNDLKLLDLCGYFDYKSHIMSLATGLVNLQHLTIGKADFFDILMFIQRSVRLKKIEIRSFRGDFNLTKLNYEREKLVGAKKVVIYLPDYAFLATKWSTQNGDTNLSKIELRRFTA